VKMFYSKAVTSLHGSIYEQRILAYNEKKQYFYYMILSNWWTWYTKYYFLHVLSRCLYFRSYQIKVL